MRLRHLVTLAQKLLMRHTLKWVAYMYVPRTRRVEWVRGWVALCESCIYMCLICRTYIHTWMSRVYATNEARRMSSWMSRVIESRWVSHVYMCLMCRTYIHTWMRRVWMFHEWVAWMSRVGWVMYMCVSFVAHTYTLEWVAHVCCTNEARVEYGCRKE